MLVFGFASLSNAQEISQCENTRLGKFVAKNSSNKTKHYKVDPSSGKVINSSTIDTSSNIFDSSVFAYKGDSTLMLRFERLYGGNECRFSLELSYNKKTLKIFHLNADGEVASEENSTLLPDKFEARKYQRDVDSFLKYFK